MLNKIGLATLVCVIASTAFAGDKLPLRKRNIARSNADPNLQWKLDASRAVAVSLADVVIPYIVDGGGRRTTIRLTNLENRAAEVEIFFIADDGTPATVALAGGRTAAALKGTIPALGMQVIVTEGALEEAQIVWSFFNAQDARVAATVTIDEKSGDNWRGSTYPASSFVAKKSIAVFDHSDSSDSQISLVNVSTAEVVVTAIIRGTDGKELFKEDVTMGSLNAIGYYPLDLVPELKGRRGTVEFTIPAATRGGIGVLNTRFYDAGGMDSLPGVTPQ
jgi:hypothetical protein